MHRRAFLGRAVLPYVVLAQQARGGLLEEKRFALAKQHQLNVKDAKYFADLDILRAERLVLWNPTPREQQATVIIRDATGETMFTRDIRPFQLLEDSLYQAAVSDVLFSSDNVAAGIECSDFSAHKYRGLLQPMRGLTNPDATGSVNGYFGEFTPSRRYASKHSVPLCAELPFIDYQINMRNPARNLVYVQAEVRKRDGSLHSSMTNFLEPDQILQIGTRTVASGVVDGSLELQCTDRKGNNQACDMFMKWALQNGAFACPTLTEENTGYRAAVLDAAHHEKWGKSEETQCYVTYIAHKHAPSFWNPNSSLSVIAELKDVHGQHIVGHYGFPMTPGTTRRLLLPDLGSAPLRRLIEGDAMKFNEFDYQNAQGALLFSIPQRNGENPLGSLGVTVVRAVYSRNQHQSIEQIGNVYVAPSF